MIISKFDNDFNIDDSIHSIIYKIVKLSFNDYIDRIRLSIEYKDNIYKDIDYNDNFIVVKPSICKSVYINQIPKDIKEGIDEVFINKVSTNKNMNKITKDFITFFIAPALKKCLSKELDILNFKASRLNSKVFAYVNINMKNNINVSIIPVSDGLTYLFYIDMLIKLYFPDLTEANIFFKTILDSMEDIPHQQF